MTPMMTSKPGYGGEVIGFKEENDFLFALHRVWTLKPQERRMERIVSPSCGRPHHNQWLYQRTE